MKPRLIIIRISLIACLAALFSALLAVPAGASNPPIKIGETLSDPAQLSSFEHDIGYKTDIYMVYQHIGDTFYADEMLPIARSGHIIQLVWEPWDPFSAAVANQPAYRLKNISNGLLDGEIRRWARELRDFGYPVRIRPMSEMNGDWTSWSGAVNGNVPSDYIPAWRHVHDIFEQEGASNVKWVWSPNRDSSTEAAQNTFNTYYPGDAYVDYIGMSGYNWGTMYSTQAWISSWQSFAEVFAYSYDVFASRSGKPLMISEVASTEAGGDKAAWITDAFNQLPARFPRFESITWFNLYKETDWRVNSSAASLAAFRDAIGRLENATPIVNLLMPAGGSWVSGDTLINTGTTDDSKVSRVDLYAGEALVGTVYQAPFDFTLHSRALADGRYTLKAVAYDYGGRSSTSQVQINVDNPSDSEYFFNWYDCKTPGMSTWLVIGNPGTSVAHAEVYIGNGLFASYDVEPGSQVMPRFPGIMGGPVKVVSTGGRSLLVSERSLFNGTFTELSATPGSGLDTDNYLTWFDGASPGIQTWLLIGNQGNQTAAVDVTIGGNLVGQYSIPNGGVIAPVFPGYMDGPVRVRSTNGQKLTVSERTLFGNSFNEQSSQPQSKQSPDIHFNWYDGVSPGMNTWLIINNMGTQAAGVYVSIGGSGTWYYTVPAGGTITPAFKGVVDGPVRITSSNGEPLLASERSLYYGSLEEVGGTDAASLAGSSWFTWYDFATAGMVDWIMVGNPNQQAANVQIRIGGVLVDQYSIPPGGRVTPAYPGVMNGPVEVSETSGRVLLVSQRVIYNSSFNELMGSPPK